MQRSEKIKIDEQIAAEVKIGKTCGNRKKHGRNAYQWSRGSDHSRRLRTLWFHYLGDGCGSQAEQNRKKMMQKEWVVLPTAWIHAGGLRKLQWSQGGGGSDKTAALMALAAIAHATDNASGIARATYDELCLRTGLSRAKLSKGLGILEGIEAIDPVPDTRSLYRLVSYNLQNGWAKFPGKSMYSRGVIAAFEEFRLRRPIELDALKLFYLFAAYRDRTSNLARIGYEKIEEYSGVQRYRIKSATSLLAALSLIYVEQTPSTANEYGVSNAYRIVGIDTYNHMGTRGRLSE